MICETRIICIGNGYIASDSAGSAVYQELQQMQLPPEIQLIDGGLAGLNLLPLLENIKRIIFVDNVSGYDEEGAVIVLDEQEVRTAFGNEQYGHDAGLPYVLNVAPRVCEGPPPDIIKLVGIEGTHNEDSIRAAAVLSLKLARGE
ncbi:MAG: hydrogenase maturation protease [Desulfobulbaceae bacterium]|nr:MAG: hydrogenase maturation protease [Desulfobulbaceae bacterium]